MLLSVQSGTFKQQRRAELERWVSFRESERDPGKERDGEGRDWESLPG